MKKAVNITVFVINLAAGLGLLASCYAGCIDPVRLPFASLAAMAVPLFAVLMPVLLVLDLIWWRKTAILAAACIALCMPPLLDNFPVNPVKPEAKGRTWTLMTYNASSLMDLNGRYEGNLNPALAYIIERDADVVCLQEVCFIHQFERFHITRAQVDTLFARYPYRIIRDDFMTVLSKFPLKPLPVDGTGRDVPGYAELAACRLDVYGHDITLFNVHLQSYNLTDSDKQVYRRMTSLDRNTGASSIKHSIVDKIACAGVERSGQTEALIRAIAKYGGHNTVVCGDFNDVPGCRSLRRLQECGLRQVYAEVGNGYMRTFNRNRMYFRIDHVLWRGDFVPVDIVRDTLTCSDHYPLVTTFAFDH